MAGRPSLYTTAGEIEAEIQEYFANEGKKTITGLAYHLGFESRQSFYDYEKDGEFSYTLKRARLKIEMGYEEGLHDAACSGSIFALKNFGWRDKVETGFTDNDGKDVRPQIIFQPAPNCNEITTDRGATPNDDSNSTTK